MSLRYQDVTCGHAKWSMKCSLSCRDLHFHLDPVEVCLEETFVEALLKFVNLLPLRGLHPEGSSANLDTHAQQVLHAMLQSAENNTNVGINSSAASSHRWYDIPPFVDVHALFLYMYCSVQHQQCIVTSLASQSNDAGFLRN